jgi:glycosyltransferase involved in cell wall biosynthesis
MNNDQILLLIPIYNDWDCARLLLAALDRQEGLQGARVLFVDDGSTVPPPAELGRSRLAPVEVLSLRRNLGHQRALAVGLAYVAEKVPCRAVVVLDGDGVPRLVRKMDEEGGRAIVFAARARRTEGIVFRLGYAGYRWLHRALTGLPVRVGNFSAIPAPLLSRLVVVSDLWNHYAASVIKARLPHVAIPTQRAKRLAGRSQMDFVALVTHGLSAISVFGDRVGVRLLIAAAALLGLTLLGILAIVAVKLGTSLAIPGWATTAAGLLLAIFFQIFTLAIVFVFVVLGGRDSSGFLPARDYPWFVAGLRQVGGGPPPVIDR